MELASQALSAEDWQGPPATPVSGDADGLLAVAWMCQRHMMDLINIPMTEAMLHAPLQVFFKSGCTGQHCLLALQSSFFSLYLQVSMMNAPIKDLKIYVMDKFQLQTCHV